MVEDKLLWLTEKRQDLIEKHRGQRVIMDYNYNQIGQRYYPMVPLLLSNKDRTHETDALIDSGSMLSLFRLEVAHQLGIDYKKGNQVRIRSVQGELLIYVHTLKL